MSNVSKTVPEILLILNITETSHYAQHNARITNGEAAVIKLSRISTGRELRSPSSRIAASSCCPVLYLTKMHYDNCKGRTVGSFYFRQRPEMTCMNILFNVPEF
jgi:hypothetical protein